MTWTYSATDISTDLAKIRLLVGDTDADDPLLTDEEIDFYLDETANIYLAAANAIDHGILPKLARDIDRNGTGYSATRSQKFQHYKDLSDKLRAKALTNSEPAFEEPNLSYAENAESDTDFVAPSFKIGQFDR